MGVLRICWAIKPSAQQQNYCWNMITENRVIMMRTLSSPGHCRQRGCHDNLRCRQWRPLKIRIMVAFDFKWQVCARGAIHCLRNGVTTHLVPGEVPIRGPWPSSCHRGQPCWSSRPNGQWGPAGTLHSRCGRLNHPASGRSYPALQPETKAYFDKHVLCERCGTVNLIGNTYNTLTILHARELVREGDLWNVQCETPKVNGSLHYAKHT